MADNVNSLEGLHIDLSMEKILLEYPLECLPSKLNKRTGKALRCPYEAIDLNLYEEGARMITFHTTLPRIQPWIKVLSIFYYDNLGKQDNIKLSWSDIPETWSDRHDAANCILIEVKNLDETLKYNLTFFVTTGTIRAQGSQYRLFTDKHFPTLIRILKQVLEHLEINATCAAVQQNNAETCVKLPVAPDNIQDNTDTCPKLPLVPEKTQTTNDHNDNNNNTVTLKVPDDQITTLENCFLGAIKKLENVTLIDSSKILDAVNACNSSIAKIIPQQGTNKSAEAICATLKQQMINLKEERDSLKAQLQHERGNILLVKSQYEDTLKHQREMLNETRNELKNLVTSTNSETAFVSNRLGEKNQEIQQLLDSERALKTTLDKAQDEILNLKSQLSDSFDNATHVTGISSASGKLCQKNEQTKYDQPPKPVALLIGTSNISGINEEKLTPDVEVVKHISYTLQECRDYILSCNPHTPPDVVVLHSLTNDLKTKSHQDCVEDLTRIITIINRKWKNTICIISLATPRRDNLKYHTNGQIVNALLKQQFSDEDHTTSVCLLDHHNLYFEGQPNSDLLKPDGYHLNEKGVSLLAMNIKKTVHHILNIPLPIRRQRSRSRNRIGRGIGRGRFR